MLLKRLELQGFKSFADKTVLDFMDGTTAVVGPNGSGKSNISDAIRWVMGETSAKSLRGSNMQDVIFTGTQTRKGLNYAEVSLVLDNSNRDFNVEFDEVIVTRRLFRSGESVYQINRANCRLKDVNELFMDTGLGRDGYSIIGQGNVSQILSTKAEDRRSIFEEAAGVSKYKYKKDEAIRKLASVDDNLVRIGDISAELESQLGPLLRQSEKARKYLDIYGEMKQLDINLSIIALDKNKADTESADEKYRSVEEELDEVRSQETENERIMNSLYDESKERDEEKTEVNAKLIQNESGISSYGTDINIIKNNIKNNEINTDRIKREIDAIKQRDAERADEIKAGETEIAEKTRESESIASSLSGSIAASDDCDARIGEIDARIAESRNEYFSRENEIAQLNERANGIETLRNSFLERKESVSGEIRAFNEGIENTRRDIEKTRNDIGEANRKLSGMRENVDDLTKRRENAEKLLKDTNAELNEKQVEYNSKSSKKKILEGLENDYAGYARSVKAVLTAKELKGLSIYGTISGLVDVEKRYVLAIETALGGALQNIIVESEQDAKAAIAYLRKTGGGRATFLPVTSVKGRTLDNAAEISSSAGYIGIASELIKYDRKYDGIFRSLLGRVVVTDNIDNAIAMSRKFGYRFKVVTLEGDVLNAGGSMSGGSVNKQSGFLSRATEVKELTADLVSLGRVMDSLRKKREEQSSELSLCESQLSTFVPLMREYENDVIRLENTLAMLEKSLEESGSSNLEDELETIEKNLRETADEVAEYIAKASSLRTKNKKLEEAMAELVDSRNELVEKKNEIAARNSDITDRIAELNKDIALKRQASETLRRELENSKREIAEREERIIELNESSESYKKSIAEKEKLLDSAKILSDEIRGRLRAIDERKAEIAEKMKQFRGVNKDITNRIIELQNELVRLENRRTKLRSDRESTINRIWDDYELTYSEAVELKTETENVKEASEHLAELKRKIRSLGSVNMDSIEEYKAVKERYEFMTKQKADLEKSKDNLVKLIDSMEDLMKEHFSEQFTEINKAFSEVFTELFGGGRGKLYLSDPDNILTSGIEIEVQLPGKGLQNINLYSGGEKSFIAIALLFAILRVKPTPFCILDEIDAALDDVNVSRFATYLKNYIDTTQFIIITHRRGSMEAASVLYGVTMQESGVSKLLSLQLDEVDDDLIKND